jgi:hypothetical protein
MSVVIDGSAGITTPGITDSAALALTGTGSKVTGDFTNATVASRNSFQTSTTNGSTGIYALPNGTSTAASWQATNAADPTNASKILIATNGSTDVQLASGINGTGTYLPLSFYTNGTQQMQLSTAGILTGTAGNLMLVQGTAQASTSGTSITFTGIPSWVKRITVLFNGMSTSGTSPKLIQIGSGSVTSTGYTSTGIITNNTSGTSGGNSTAGFIIYNVIATDVISGSMTLYSVSSNTWVSSHVVKNSTFQSCTGGGDVTLSGALDRVVITTVNGTDTFDAGSINILYE